MRHHQWHKLVPTTLGTASMQSSGAYTVVGDVVHNIGTMWSHVTWLVTQDDHFTLDQVIKLVQRPNSDVLLLINKLFIADYCEEKCSDICQFVGCPAPQAGS